MEDKIILAHGDGGVLTQKLLQDVIIKKLSNPWLVKLLDSAILDIEGKRLAFTTDSYVVKPIFFPGADIGKLSVFGTVNDLAVSGAIPLFLTFSLIIEEGFPIKELAKIIDSVKKAARKAKVQIVSGDTKVVEKGSADELFINTSGIGILPEGVLLSPNRIRVGDAIIVSGAIAQHGVSVLARRSGLSFYRKIVSDCAPLNFVIETLLKELKEDVHFLRDLTRGGLGTVLCEAATSSKKDFLIKEKDIPLKRNVKGACEAFGIDPLYVANEGRFVAFVNKNSALAALSLLQKHTLCKDASIIGNVMRRGGSVILLTLSGAERKILPLTGTPLPRIC